MGRRSPEKKKDDRVFRRLPKCVVPVHYDLWFQPSNHEPVLHGKLSLRVQVMCETREIVLNGLNISVSDVKYTCEGSKGVQETGNILINGEMETIQIEFPNPLTVGFGTLALNFEAEITDNMKGLYRTKVGDGKRYNFITHFEPVNARRCFPGFDEPAFKATFDITLVVPKDVVAISNMPIEDEKVDEKNENLKVCKFQTTPKMSTYLIAMVIGDFEHIQKTTANLIDHYTKYFGVSYPLPKCDLVAIAEFPIGGMENYGLITFIDTRLMVDPTESSAWNIQMTSLIVAHEEGFAKFIEYLAVDHFFPQFDIWTQFASRILHSALATDSLKNSHPVEVEVTNPGDIDEIFDALTYNKGSSIVKMMYHYVGDECFRKGMKQYLEKFKYSNAETADLWEALEAASGTPVGRFMDTFTKQMGYPIVTVLDVVSTDCGKTFTLKQEKFWADPKLNEAASNSNYKWIIPLTCCKGSKPLEVTVLELFDGNESNLKEVAVTCASNDEWIKFNAGSVGFYRVRYSAEVLSQFTNSIKDKSMSPLDRLGLLNDVYACVKAGISSTTDILNLLDSFKLEDNYSVLSSIRDITADLSNLLLRTDLVDKFDTYCTSLFTPIKERMGWDPKNGESHADGLLRSLVINRLISCKDETTINEAEKMFDQHLKGEKKISADLRTAVYRATLFKGNEKTLDTMIEIFKNCELSEEKARILQSLGSTKDINLMKKILDFALSPDVKMSEIDYIFYSLNNSKHGQDLTWQFFKDNIKLFQEKYPGGMLICSVVRDVTGGFVGDEFAQEIETFLKENPIRGTERTVQQVVEKIRINAAWLKRDLNAISTFLGSK
ncbi:Puromycin-sensitive aminopeptidase [Folsomia candida]|uniref:Aminopeptidase n=1 Tax=Folsomia candida TaxID=158441 RepID=A0A226EPG5_FOLCA|nr:Puromycin-sensitive aminopeptidase [Folsomia candida]